MKTKLMAKYEIMTIYKIDLGESEAKELSNKVSDLIKSLKGKILNQNFWGKRKFAYEIKHNSEGYYDVFDFEVDSSKLGSFKKKLNLMDNVVRYLITAQKG